MNKKFRLVYHLFLTLVIWLFSMPVCQAKTFDVEGGDLMLGVGAKAKALSGAVSAGVNDIYAVY